jgi:hypothetical protein
LCGGGHHVATDARAFASAETARESKGGEGGREERGEIGRGERQTCNRLCVCVCVHVCAGVT